MDLGIAGRTALVTGAGRGIGRAIAEVLAAEGAHVVLVSRTADELYRVAEAIAAAGGAATPLPLDITDATAVAAAIEALEAGGLPVEILINNANVNLEAYQDFVEVPADRWGWVFEQNLGGLANVTRRVLPGMTERGWGRVVNVGSLAGVIGGAKQVPYATLKASLEGFSRSLALEVSRHGVTVNVVHPGLVPTERTEAVVKDKARKWIELKTATRKLSTPRDVAHAIAFLASDLAGNITGASLPVSGGVELGFSL
ncbi:MAG TPA: SDR family NAD(P)-dependent oxidoreductase [Oscillatoriaceae cyanobacterium]